MRYAKSMALGIATLSVACNATSPPKTEPSAWPRPPRPVVTEAAKAGLKRADDPKTVLVVYRSNCPDFNKNGMGDSEEIARYYAQRRGIPKENLLSIKVDAPYLDDVYNKYAAWPYDAFQKQLVSPLRAKLTALGQNNILYIVTVFGLPIRVNLPGIEKP